jgi:hypothetical protein
MGAGNAGTCVTRRIDNANLLRFIRGASLSSYDSWFLFEPSLPFEMIRSKRFVLLKTVTIGPSFDCAGKAERRRRFEW